MKLKRENQQLIEENNLLKLKMEILFDMVRTGLAFFKVEKFSNRIIVNH